MQSKKNEDATISQKSLASEISVGYSPLSPVAGFMDYDPKYAASMSHRINKRTANFNKNAWFKF